MPGHRNRHERVLTEAGDVAGHRLRGDATAKLGWLQSDLPRDRLNRCLRGDDLPYRRWVRRLALDLHPARGERLAEVHDGLGPIDLGAPERDQVADHDPSGETGEGEP